MVEGGSRILGSVARRGLFDRWTIYYAPVVIGGTTAPPIVEGEESMGPDDQIRLTLERVDPLGEGYVATYGPRSKVGGAGPAPTGS